MAELHPDADVTDGAWLNESAGSTLSTSIDEITINDSDYIQSSVMPSSADVCEVAIDNPLSGAVPGQPMTVSYRFKKGGTSGNLNLTVSLIQGTTVIASWTESSISSTFSTSQKTLSGAEFAAISDFTDLRLRFSSLGVAAYAGPGDVVAGAFAWWGLRAYTLASIGANAVRLRETGGDTEQDFVTIAGGGLDLAAISTFKGANNLFVVKVYDQSGGGRDQSQATKANQPAFILSGLGSLPVMRGGAGLFMAATGFGNGFRGHPGTVSAVSKLTSDARGGITGSSDNSATQSGFRVSAANQAYMFAGAIFGATANINTWHALQAVYNGASSDMNVNGSANTGDPSNVSYFVETAVAIFNDSSVGGGFALQGDLTEVGYWASGFSGANSSAMSSNQHAYWGF